MKQQKLIDTTPVLVLEYEDGATSDDPLEACLERLGYTLKRQAQLKERIADKLTPSLFSGQTEPLDVWEKIYQADVDKCIKRLKGAC